MNMQSFNAQGIIQVQRLTKLSANATHIKTTQHSMAAN